MKPRSLQDSRTAAAHAAPVAAAWFAMAVIVIGAATTARGELSVTRAVVSEHHRQFLTSHCQRCHGEAVREGGVRLDDLPLEIADLQTAERWQKVLDALNSGEMPPQDEQQPAPQAKADFLDGLAHAMVAARRSLADQHGRIAMRRLNRREYKNTLRSLLGVEADVSELPADTDTGGFDTVGANLFISDNTFEQYESLGREAIEEAFGLAINAGFAKTFRYEAEETLPIILKEHLDQMDRNTRAIRWVEAVDAAISRPENADVVAKLREEAGSDVWTIRRSWQLITAAPSPESFGFVTKENNADQARHHLHTKPSSMVQYFEQPHLDTGGYLTINQQWQGNSWIWTKQPFDFPPGDYVFRIRAGLTGSASSDRRFLEFGLAHHYGAVISTHEVTGTIANPCVIEIPITLTRKHDDRNQNTLFVREKGTGDSYEQGRDRFDEAKKRNGSGPELAIWVDWLELERLPRAAADTPPGIQALSGIPFDDAAQPLSTEAVRSAVERFAYEAFRGVRPPAGYVDRLLAVYTAAIGSGQRHAAAFKETLAVVLASPGFLYRAEPALDEGRRLLNGNELATRLAYFLWGCPPDQQLRDLAQTGDLLQPAVLAAQTERLLDDPRSRGFVEGFTSQWLHLARLDFFMFNQQHYPHFDNSTKIAVRREVYETVAHLVRENASLRDLLAANHVVANAELAGYYGLVGVTGDAYRKVTLPAGSPRGGLLGMAAIHAMGSNGEHTSPVERGAWVLRKLLNDPSPPAPANVPAITRLAGQVLTTRERLLVHQEQPQCASCHRKIDPIGLAMENFDAVGQWRTEDSSEAKDDAGKPLPGGKKTWTIEPAGAFHGGPSFAGFQELRAAIALRHEDFARGFASALVEYALGRPCGFSDHDLVESIVVRGKIKNYPIRELIHALVASQAFQSK